MKISVCMIVKDEQKVLARCLDCVKCFADEIIIVDTGSSDNTKQIAKTYTTNVFDFLWCDNFSKARNFAFSKATCDYLMWLDADDIIPEEEQLKIIKLKKLQSPSDTYMFKYVSQQDECGYTQFYFYRERLIRNCKMAKFTGFIHEYIVPFGKITYLDIEILHGDKKDKNIKRNLEIFNKNISKGVVLTTRDKYYYAKEFFYLGEYNKCLEKIIPLIKNPSMSDSDLYDCYITIFKCEEFLGHSSIKYLFKALERFQPTSELLCLIALHYENNHCIKKAITYYKMSVCAPTYESKFGFKNSYYDTLFPLLKLVFLLYNDGKIEQAIKIHQILQNKFPNYPEVKHNEEFFNKLKCINNCS